MRKSGSPFSLLLFLSFGGSTDKGGGGSERGRFQKPSIPSVAAASPSHPPLVPELRTGHSFGTGPRKREREEEELVLFLPPPPPPSSQEEKNYSVGSPQSIPNPLGFPPPLTCILGRWKRSDVGKEGTQKSPSDWPFFLLGGSCAVSGDEEAFYGAVKARSRQNVFVFVERMRGDKTVKFLFCTIVVLLSFFLSKVVSKGGEKRSSRSGAAF